MDCLYCKLVKNELHIHKVGENEKNLAFLDINPLVKGHTLVIPKSHAATFFDINEEATGELFIYVREITELLQTKLNPDGFNIGINMHKAAGQAVEHLHIHIIPRWQGDGGGNIHSIIKNPPQESLEEILEKINK